MHLNALYWLLNIPEVSHVHIVIGKDNGPISQDQKAKMWEILLKSEFSPQATVIKSKDKGPLGEVYSIFEEKGKPAYIALNEKAARNKELQKKFAKFPNYGMQLLPSQFSKSSLKLHQAAIDGDRTSAKAELPDDFSDSQIDEYMRILSKPVVTDEPLEDKSPLINYKEEYTKKFSDGFWNSVFQPLKEDDI
jgi:hypothetical protein